MRCAIWYHLYVLKNVKNTHKRVLFLVKFDGCFSLFLNCTNDTKSRNASHVDKRTSHERVMYAQCTLLTNGLFFGNATIAEIDKPNIETARLEHKDKTFNFLNQFTKN